MKIFALSLFLGCFQFAMAQSTLQAHAGVDTSFCGFLGPPAPDIYILGANVPATGGVLPYTYHWDISPKPFINHPDNPVPDLMYASDLILDTTAANPTLYLSLVDNAGVTFILTVTDAENNTATDSIMITRSDWSIGLGYIVISASTGDTQTISPGAFAGGIEPYTFDWGTSPNLIGEQFDYDVYSSESWPNRHVIIPQPSSSIHWHPYITVTDAAGCALYLSTFEMFLILPSSTDEADLLSGLKIFPNPVKNVLSIQMPASPIIESRILKVSGKEIALPKLSILGEIGTLNVEHLPSGIYVLHLKTNDGYYFKKFAKAD